MDPITIAMLVAAGIKGAAGLGKAIAGGVQANRARKELAKEFPKYSRPEEYDKLLSLYQREAGRGELPGQDRYEARISESTSRGVRSAAKYADSPVAAVAASSQLYGQQQSAIRDLGLQYAAFLQRAQQNLAGAYQMGAQYSDKEWWQNVGYPDQVKRNMAAQRLGAGQQNLWGGIDMFGAAAIDAAGIYSATQGGGNGMGLSQGSKAYYGGQTSPQNAAAMQGLVNNAPIPGGGFGLTPPQNVYNFGITDPYNYYNPR
jgi:hypothetical protein